MNTDTARCHLAKLIRWSAHFSFSIGK